MFINSSKIVKIFWKLYHVYKIIIIFSENVNYWRLIIFDLKQTK